MLPDRAASNSFYEPLGRGTTWSVIMMLLVLPMLRMLRGCSGIAAVVALVACNSGKERSKSEVIAAIASASLAIRAAAPMPAPSVSAAPEKAVVPRPKDTVDLILSPEKRARVEALAPEAKGFLAGEEIEQKLYGLELKRGKDSDAVKALDQLARGKWVLFTGNIGSITPEGCELPIRYTPKDPNDSLGLTSVWLPIKITKIKGYDAAEYRPGELAAILAHYDGEMKAGQGYDVVQLRSWFAP
jgi:hypothetical protein